MDETVKPQVTISVADVKNIKNFASSRFNDPLPRGLDAGDIQALLICQGFLSVLGSKGYQLPVKVVFKPK